jgi:hypothetical protein
MWPIRGCIQRAFCAACPAPEKKFAPDGCDIALSGLGVDVRSLAAHEFTLAYFQLAKNTIPIEEIGIATS